MGHWDGTGRDKSMAVQTPKTMNRLMLYVECFNKWNGMTVLNRTSLYLGKKNKGEKKKERKKEKRKKEKKNDEEQQSALLFQLT